MENKNNQSTPSKDPHFEREQTKYENPVASREYLLTLLQKSNKALSFLDFCSLLDAHDEQQRIGIQRRLRAMEREGQLLFNKQKKYEIQTENVLVKGRVIGHRDGFGFLKHSSTEKDYFIPMGQMSSLLHGDVVEGTLGTVDRKGRTEFRVKHVVEPRVDNIVGRYFNEQGVGIVIPDDNRICHEFIIPADAQKGARQGNVVVIKVTKRPQRHMNPSAKIIEVLGEHMAPGMEIEAALRTFDIPSQWPQAVQRYVKNLPESVPDESKSGRVDLRDLPLVTIDGEDARDFDDAVYCQPEPNGGWRLWVAIADVSSYVKLGTALDTEAQNRATSVYFPEQVIPMLPETLSNGLCSLNPDVDRLCMVCEIQIDSGGKLNDYQFYEAVMRSKARLTYTKVWSILSGDTDLLERYSDRVVDLNNLYSLYKVLKGKRIERGAIEFESNETKFVFNAARKIDHIIPLVRNDAHKIIEECMIMANVCAANYIEQHEAEALFRVHDKPDEERLTSFRSYLAEVGIEFNLANEPTPQDFAELAKRIETRLDKELIQTMLLRSMKQAVYDGENIGHFGLSLEAYAHFTSPIRRYPDLVVHRVIKAIINKQANKKVCKGAKFYTEQEIELLGEQCSMAERRADDATRDVSDWLKCEFMLDHVGDVYEGVVASVTNFGFFVRITEYQIDGLVHITSLSDDYYQYDDVKQYLVGQSAGKIYRLGDQVSVKVVSVNLDDRKIDLMIEGQAELGRRSKRSNKSERSSSKPSANKSRGDSRPSSSKGDKNKGKQTRKSRAKPASKKQKGSRNKPRRNK